VASFTRARRAGLGALLVLGVSACRTPQPKALFAVSDTDAYWAVEPAMGGEQYIAPTLKFRLTNRSPEAQHSVQAMAVFRRKGEENLSWGSAFEQVVSHRAPLAGGQSILVTLKSDARYHSAGTIEGMFSHPQFKDATVEYFLRVGSSGWISFGRIDVEHRVGSRSVAAEPGGITLSSPSLPPPSSPSPSAH
jgi:hypothetical protein